MLMVLYTVFSNDASFRNAFGCLKNRPNISFIVTVCVKLLSRNYFLIVEGETYMMKDMALSVCSLIQRPGSKLRNLSISHVSTIM